MYNMLPGGHQCDKAWKGLFSSQLLVVCTFPENIGFLTDSSLPFESTKGSSILPKSLKLSKISHISIVIKYL